MNPTEIKKESVVTDPEVAKDLANEVVSNQVEETLDAEPNNEEVDQLSEIKAKMETYRENIKKGEAKDENGNYNEALVLENEAKLREAEKAIKRMEQEKVNNQEIVELESKINEYRDAIKEGEKNYDEKSVLENEDKLREAEKKILNLKKEIEDGNFTEKQSKEEGEISKIREELKAEIEKDGSTSGESLENNENLTKKDKPKKQKKSFWQKFSDFMNK